MPNQRQHRNRFPSTPRSPAHAYVKGSGGYSDLRLPISTSRVAVHRRTSLPCTPSGYPRVKPACIIPDGSGLQRLRGPSSGLPAPARSCGSGYSVGSQLAVGVNFRANYPGHSSSGVPVAGQVSATRPAAPCCAPNRPTTLRPTTPVPVRTVLVWPAGPCVRGDSRC